MADIFTVPLARILERWSRLDFKIMADLHSSLTYLNYHN